ncbi:MAG: sigma-54-dependent Fis family transcriptional regulator [Caulobacteraceae bacterium]|nr:sigma-54-dependent Fis family transcriptional regulator [Caulobacter sp.]
MRCLARGLDPRLPPRELLDTSTSLARVREQRANLRRIARVEVDLLHRLIQGSRHTIALSDPDGMILDVLEDGGLDDHPLAALVRPGSVWAEARCGTNGIGTAVHLRKRINVLGHQHFFACFAGLACIAAPIFASDGTLAGVLDASCDRRLAHPHTQALIVMAATQIENALMRDRHRDDIVVAVHPWSEAVSMRAAGLVALDRDGVVLGLNSQARALLGPACRKGHFGDLFATSFSDMLVEGRRRDRQQLVTRRGERLQATLETVRALDALRAARPAEETPAAGGFVAEDAGVAAIVRQVDAAARRKLPILIRGETGTGKEQMARHAHAASGRRGAFVPVNCASLPASLVEAELFGYVEGAFTGARKGGSLGLARQADGGTLFLDEIGDMPVTLQAVLLRFLDDYTVRPVGGSGAKVDVFLVSATNAGLDEAIAQGRFRMDLLYRLNTLEVALPSLSARGDFARILDHLLGQIDGGCAITDGARARLAADPWPGNIRQLRNMLARLSLAARDGIIDEKAVVAALGPRREAEPADTSLKESQRSRILAAYERAGGNISETSRRLNVSRNTVYRALGKR